MLDQLTTTVNEALDRAKTELGKLATIDLTDLDLSKLDVRNVDLPKVDLSDIDWSKFDVRNIDWSKFDVRNIDLPSVDLPSVKVPDVDLPAGVERAADVARDVAYAGIGAAVMVAERIDAEVRRAVSRVS